MGVCMWAFFTRKMNTIQLPRIQTLRLTGIGELPHNSSHPLYLSTIATKAHVCITSNTFHSYEFLLPFYINQKIETSLDPYSIRYGFRRPNKGDKHSSKKRKIMVTMQLCSFNFIISFTQWHFYDIFGFT